jgi:hypothetical protein
MNAYPHYIHKLHWTCNDVSIWLDTIKLHRLSFVFAFLGWFAHCFGMNHCSKYRAIENIGFSEDTTPMFSYSWLLSWQWSEYRRLFPSTLQYPLVAWLWYSCANHCSRHEHYRLSYLFDGLYSISYYVSPSTIRKYGLRQSAWHVMDFIERRYNGAS